MSYDVTVIPVDTNGYYSPLPVLTGSVFVPPPASGTFATPLSTISAVPATPFTLNFPSPPVPPAAVSALLITETVSGGDVLRSGAVTTLPASSAAPFALTVPPVLIAAATLTASAASFFLPPTVVPGGIRWGSGILTLGTSIPLVVALSPPTVTLGPGIITVTATGSVVVRHLYFFVRTLPFTFTCTLTLAPSGDPTDTSRVLRVTPTASAITGVPTVTGLEALIPAAILASSVESFINAKILSDAASEAAKPPLRMGLVPSTVICAHKITIIPSSATSRGGINLQLVLSNLFRMPIVALPKDLNVSISPTPVEAALNTYTVTVTDAVTGAPIHGARVALHNFSPTGTFSTNSATTDSAGRAVFRNVTLHSKIINPKAERIDISPTLTVTAALYASVTLDLL